MASRSKQMKVLDDLLAKKREELNRLQIEIATLEDARRRALGVAEAPRRRAPRSDVKNMVLKMLEEVGAAGLVATTAVELAEKRGTRLERGTVSSLLSRLKHDNIVRYDGNVYRLVSVSANADEATGKPEATVHSFPASKSAL